MFCNFNNRKKFQNIFTTTKKFTSLKICLFLNNNFIAFQISLSNVDEAFKSAEPNHKLGFLRFFTCVYFYPIL